MSEEEKGIFEIRHFAQIPGIIFVHYFCREGIAFFGMIVYNVYI